MNNSCQLHLFTDDWQLVCHADAWHLTTTGLVIVTDEAANMLEVAQLGSVKHIQCFERILNLAAE